MRRNGLLVLLLLVLLGVWYFVIREKTPVVSVDRPLVAIDTTGVTGMEIDAPEYQVNLRLQSGEWLVSLDGGDYPANQTMVSRALERFSQLSKQALISERPERFRDFEVDDSAGVKVALSGKEPLAIYFGKAGPTFQTSYARLDGENKIWEVSGNHRGTFNRKAGDWRDKTINSYEMADFNKIELIYPEEKIELVKQDSLWQASANGKEFKTKANLVERVARMLSRMNTVEFADSLAEDAFDNPECRILGTLNSGDVVDIRLIKKDDDQYYLRKAGAKSDFVVHNSTANALMRKVDDLTDKEPDE